MNPIFPEEEEIINDDSDVLSDESVIIVDLSDDDLQALPTSTFAARMPKKVEHNVDVSIDDDVQHVPSRNAVAQISKKVELAESDRFCISITSVKFGQYTAIPISLLEVSFCHI